MQTEVGTSLQRSVDEADGETCLGGGRGSSEELIGERRKRTGGGEAARDREDERR